MEVQSHSSATTTTNQQRTSAFGPKHRSEISMIQLAGIGYFFPKRPTHPPIHLEGRPSCFRRLQSSDGSDWIGEFSQSADSSAPRPSNRVRAAHHLDSTPLSRHPPKNQQNAPSSQPHPASRTNNPNPVQKMPTCVNEPQPKHTPNRTQKHAVSFPVPSALVVCKQVSSRQ